MGETQRTEQWGDARTCIVEAVKLADMAGAAIEPELSVNQRLVIKGQLGLAIEQLRTARNLIDSGK